MNRATKGRIGVCSHEEDGSISGISATCKKISCSTQFPWSVRLAGDGAGDVLVQLPC